MGLQLADVDSKIFQVINPVIQAEGHGHIDMTGQLICGQAGS